MLTKAKRVAKGSAVAAQKTPASKPQARMPTKQALAGSQKDHVKPTLGRPAPVKGLAPAKQTKGSTAKIPAHKTSSEKIPADSVFPADFFAVMDELDGDAKKRRAVALEVMKKTVAE